jgi:hypothetical protein
VFYRRRPRAPWPFASASAPAFAPTDIAGLEAWFKADAGVTEAAGLVSLWANQASSGSNRDLTQSTGSAKMTYTASDADFNSLPSLSSSDGWRLMKSASTWSTPVAQPLTFYLAMKFTASGTGYIVDTHTTGNCALLSDTGQFETYYGGTFPTHGGTAATHLVWWTANGASSEIGIDDVDALEAASNGTTGLDGLRIGSNPSEANPAPSGTKWCELLVYSTAHNVTQRGQVFAYLSNRTGISYTP